MPKMLPQVAWRTGLDLNPIDVNDPAEAAWLETLVWPEQTDRLVRLRAAMTIAATVRPRLTKGDLRHDLIARRLRCRGKLPASSFTLPYKAKAAATTHRKISAAIMLIFAKRCRALTGNSAPPPVIFTLAALY